MSHRTRSLLAISTLAGVTAALVPLAPAAATTVQCGDVLTTDTVLTSDLVCGPDSDGLVIGADGIRLDLGGHTISGPGAYATPYAAVRSAQHTGVRIEKGRLTGFQAGVVLDESTSSVLTRLSVYGDDQGINLAGGSGHLVTRNHVYANGRDAIRLGLSAHNRIRGNLVNDNTFGIGVADGSSDNEVEDNIVSRNGDFGIGVFGAATGTEVERNLVSRSQVLGIQVSADSTGSSLLRNQVSRSGSDGIHVEAPLTRLTENVARHNAALGIFAPGATDGGGNRASGNGDPAQCVGVACGS